MPLYFFHLTDGDLIEEDDVGQELPDPLSALREAERFASEICSDVEHPGRAFVRVADLRGNEAGIVLVPPTRALATPS
jgi:hypothetical protein